MPFNRLKAVVRSLHFRLTAWNTLALLCFVMFTLVGVREGVQRTLVDEFDRVLYEDMLEIRLGFRQLTPEWDRLYRTLERKAQGHVQDDWFVQIFDASGKLQWASEKAPHFKFTPDSPDSLLPFDRLPYRVLQSRIEEPGKPPITVRVGASQASITDEVSRLTQVLLITGVAILVVAPLVGNWLAVRAIRPLAQIIETTQRLHPSKLDERLPIRHTGDELEKLSVTINGMLDRIALHLDQNRDFVANAAHELRSPLAAIRSTVEVALNRERGPEEYEALLADVMEECSSLGNLVNRLLVLAEGDAGRIRQSGETGRLDEIVRRSVAMFEGVAELRGVQLRSGRIDRALTVGDENSLRQVVQNLIDNAIKFTLKGGQVTVSLRREPGKHHVCLSVEDTGAGIPAGELSRVFERFYRGDRSRPHEAGRKGNGLGLSICDSVVRALGGEITVQSSVGVGTTFNVYLPLAERYPVAHD